MSPKSATSPHVFAAVFLGAVLLHPSASVTAQCSDAGACTISRHLELEEAERSRTMGLRYTFGVSGSPDDVTYHSVVAEAHLQVLSHSRVIATLPYNWQRGPLGSVNGLGDLVAVWDQTFLEWEHRTGRFGVQLGGRFGMGDANAAPGLPMAYQPGLGSTDLIVGASAVHAAFSGGAAYQVAGARNNNELVRLQRGNQLVLWGNYRFGWEKTTVVPGITVINQFQESSVVDTTLGWPATVSVPGSDQLQINLGLRATHELSSTLVLEFFGAIPLRPRDVNVDGLKRALTLSVGLSTIL